MPIICSSVYLEIEIPTSLNIRPVLKAHDINDGQSFNFTIDLHRTPFLLDFLEVEGDLIRKPVKKKRVSLTKFSFHLPSCFSYCRNRLLFKLLQKRMMTMMMMMITAVL
jgi:hypothetical protein